MFTVAQEQILRERSVKLTSPQEPNKSVVVEKLGHGSVVLCEAFAELFKGFILTRGKSSAKAILEGERECFA